MYKRIIALFVIVTACVTLTGCSDVTTPAVFGYMAGDAEFDVIFHSDGSGDVAASVAKVGEGMTLTVTSPERSADMRVICSPDGCVLIPAGDGGIPLSSRAAEGLSSVFSLLYRGNDGAEIKKSSDGDGTVIVYGDGEVRIGDDMLPTSVTVYGDEHGRTVLIRNYKIT